MKTNRTIAPLLIAACAGLVACGGANSSNTASANQYKAGGNLTGTTGTTSTTPTNPPTNNPTQPVQGPTQGPTQPPEAPTMGNMTATWVGTLAPCGLEGNTGECSVNGIVSTMSAQIQQVGTSNTMTGTYFVTNVIGFSSGVISMDPSSGDEWTSKVWQFTMTDQNGKVYTALVKFSSSQACSGTVTDNNGHYWAIELSH